MDFWSSDAWHTIQARLSDLELENKQYVPDREHLFRALDLSPFLDTNVAIIGQDPYPSPSHATGVAFSVPLQIKPDRFPPTLDNILMEYTTDLHYDYPTHGNLENWARQGVLLWNAYPTCLAHKPLSHNWDEWTLLTKEIRDSLSKRGNCVFVLLGAHARSLADGIDKDMNNIIQLSHPAPRGFKHGNDPFSGSRMFSRINEELVDLGREPINWKL